jgi:hypothetical protein
MDFIDKPLNMVNGRNSLILIRLSRRDVGWLQPTEFSDSLQSCGFHPVWRGDNLSRLFGARNNLAGLAGYENLVLHFVE